MEQQAENNVRERKCRKEKNSQAVTKRSKRIIIPIERDEYAKILPEGETFRNYVDSMIAQYPELFPIAIGGMVQNRLTH